MSIKDRFLPYIKGFFVGIIVSVCFLAISALFAWTSPTSDPPGGNVSGPINISAVGQTKQGGLMINTAGADVGLIVLKGKVGVGTENPIATLDVDGSFYYEGGDGDVNDDGGITASDSLKIMNYVAGNIDFTREQYARADVDGDGKVTNLDAHLILLIVNETYTIEEVHLIGKQIADRTIDLDYDGNVKIQNNLSAKGDILDVDENIIYNSATGKIERNKLPFEQGDIVSDVDTNTWDSGYYNVTNLIPGNVKDGVSYGRGQIGIYGGTLDGMDSCPFSDSDIGSVWVAVGGCYYTGQKDWWCKFGTDCARWKCLGQYYYYSVSTSAYSVTCTRHGVNYEHSTTCIFCTVTH